VGCDGRSSARLWGHVVTEVIQSADMFAFFLFDTALPLLVCAFVQYRDVSLLLLLLLRVLSLLDRVAHRPLPHPPLSFFKVQQRVAGLAKVRL
jgi:hypothetical protein